jgi:hypothetical protein
MFRCAARKCSGVKFAGAFSKSRGAAHGQFGSTCGAPVDVARAGTRPARRRFFEVRKCMKYEIELDDDIVERVEKVRAELSRKEPGITLEQTVQAVVRANVRPFRCDESRLDADRLGS